MKSSIKLLTKLSPRGHAVFRCLCLLPPHLRERLIFNGLLRQAFLQRIIGGPLAIRMRYCSGLLRGCEFNCLSSEKYFFMGKDYENDLLGVISPLLRENSIIYDIGAHAGFWSLVFSRLSPEGKIFAFEPSPVNLSRLRSNTEIIDNIVIVPFAVSNISGTANFSDDGSFSSICLNGDTQVNSITLDKSYYQLPDFIKIDVEGHAAEALQGARRILEKARPAILAEIHSAHEMQEVSSLLLPLGYRIERLKEPVRTDAPFHILGLTFVNG
jgi:FkbM family methyltransferase